MKCAIAIVLLAACGHAPTPPGQPDAAAGADAGPPDATPTPAAEIDGPDGAHVSIPAGAGVDPSTIAIAIATDAPPLGARAAVGPVFALTPHAAHFAVPVTIRLPFDATMLAADQPPILYTAEPGGPWTAVPGAHVVGAFIEAQVDHFSYDTVGAPMRPLSFVQIGAGQTASCALNVTGDVYCWGQNVEGELGNAMNNSQDKFVPVGVVGGVTFGKLFVGAISSCGIAITGDTYCWGGDAAGEIGDGLDTSQGDVFTPHKVVGNHQFITLAIGAQHVCGITSTDETWCWGYNGSGQLTDVSPVGIDMYTATPVRLALAFSEIAAGGDTTCGTTTAGDTYCWGDNTYGQLGTGDSRTSVAQPVKLAHSFASLAIGAQHACGIDQAGKTWCWGDDSLGQLGDGMPASMQSTPVAVAGNPQFATISAGPAARSTCAIAASGVASCWGRNDYGQLGIGVSPAIATTPTAVAGVSFATISTGNLHGCGIGTDQRAWCWGSQEVGAVGDGPSTGSFIEPTPRLVSVN